jgi:hypothetical protein
MSDYFLHRRHYCTQFLLAQFAQLAEKARIISTMAGETFPDAVQKPGLKGVSEQTAPINVKQIIKKS